MKNLISTAEETATNGRWRAIFDHAPVAGLLAVVLVFAVDTWALGVRGPWDWLLERLDPRRQVLETGIVRDQLEFRRLLELPAERRRVVIVGSSRAQAGIRPASNDSEVTFAKIAHAGLRSFEIRTLATELIRVGPDLVVIVLSEFDLNRSIRISPDATYGSFSAIGDLIAETGIRFSFKHRRMLFRLTIASMLKAYRFRSVLHRSFADNLSSFELDERFVRRKSPRRGPPVLLETEGRRTVTKADKQRILATAQELLPHVRLASLKNHFNMINEITHGPHSRIHRNLFRRTVESLREAGIQVVIAEAPLHPLSSQIYDSTIRQEFLAFVATLQDDLEVYFVPLESSGPYTSEDFGDMIHLRRGSAKLTRAVDSVIREALASSDRG